MYIRVHFYLSKCNVYVPLLILIYQEELERDRKNPFWTDIQMGDAV